MTSTFLFLMMLMNGPATVIDDLSNEQIFAMKNEMREFAKNLQINDSNVYYDNHYPYGMDDDYYKNELIGYWENYQLLKNTPRLEEYGRRFQYQNLKAVEAALRFNKEFEKELTKKLDWELDRAPFYQLVLDENAQCREIWNKIMLLTCEEDYYGEGLKRRTYLQLKKLIDEKDWLNPDYIPPEVPIWRFYEKGK